MKKQYWTYLCLSFFWMLSNPILATQLEAIFIGEITRIEKDQVDIIEDCKSIMNKIKQQSVSRKEFAYEVVKQVKKKKYATEKVSFFVKKDFLKMDSLNNEKKYFKEKKTLALTVIVTTTNEEYKQALENSNLAEVKLGYSPLVKSLFGLFIIAIALSIAYGADLLPSFAKANEYENDEKDWEYEYEE